MNIWLINLSYQLDISCSTYLSGLVKVPWKELVMFFPPEWIRIKSLNKKNLQTLNWEEQISSQTFAVCSADLGYVWHHMFWPLHFLLSGPKATLHLNNTECLKSFSS